MGGAGFAVGRDLPATYQYWVAQPYGARFLVGYFVYIAAKT